MCFFNRIWCITVAGSVREDFDGFGGREWRFTGSDYVVGFFWLGYLGSWSDWQPLGAGKFVPGLWVRDDDVRRVLMGLREGCGDFLCPGPLLRTSGLSLLEDTWSELCLNEE